jgi:hypothetical protein
MSEDMENLVLLVSEADNTCDAVSSLADGSYTDAAFLVSLVGWSDYGPGTIDIGGEDPALMAGAYVIFGGEAVGLSLMGDDTYMTVMYLEPGDTFEFHVNIDDTDPSRGAEGSGSACYCEGLAGFAFPLFEG